MINELLWVRAGKHEELEGDMCSSEEGHLLLPNAFEDNRRVAFVDGYI